MELVNNFSFIQAAAQQLIGQKNCSYNSQDLWSQTYKFPSLKCEMSEITCTQNLNETFYFYHIYDKKQRSRPYIIYLHGLSSYCMEGIYLLQNIHSNYNFCVYDSRGHGKNKNKKVTYGLKQAGDLYDLIMHLYSKDIQEFYLWGRSMGASTILSFLNTYGSMDPIKDIVKFVVLDSPFYSFEQIAKQTVAKSMNIPSFICSPLVNIAMNRIYEKDKINLRELNFGSLHYVKCPAAFIYSEKDEVVLWSHTQQIMKGYGGKIFQLHGQFSHNEPRPNYITQKVISYFCQDFRKHRCSAQTLKNSQKKGLSISLISSKTLRQQQKQNKSPIKPLKPATSKKISALIQQKSQPVTHRGNRLQQQQQVSISQGIQQQAVEQSRKRVKIVHQVIEERSKHKLKVKHFTLTNRKYV